MEETLKQIMGEAYKADMTSEEIQSFFKTQVLSTGAYVNKDAAEAEKRKLQGALDAKNAELQSRMTDDEKKAAADKELQNQIAELQKQLLQGKVSNNQYKAMSTTAKSRVSAGIEDDDKDFNEFISSISSDDEVKTSKIANYINVIVEKAYNKGKSDATKNSLGKMGSLNIGSENAEGAKTGAEEMAERLAKAGISAKPKKSYFN